MTDSIPTPEDRMLYRVVVNAEEQYSIWPCELEIPLGWKELAMTGSKKECIKYIADTWTDMRPLSIRKKLE